MANSAFLPFSPAVRIGCLALALLGTAPVHAQRTYIGGHYQLDLAGTSSRVHSVEGGRAYGQIAEEATDAGAISKKHIGNVKYEDIKIALGMGGGTALKDWIRSTLDAQHTRKSGAFHSAEVDYKVASTITFTDALLTAISIPALDVDANEPGFLEVTLSPEFTEAKPDAGWIDPDPRGIGKQEAWLPSDFRLEIQGLDCSKIMKIDAITIKQTPAKIEVGEANDPSKEPGKLEFPNVILTLPESAAKSFQDYFDSFVIKGNSGESQEKSGSLVLLSRNRKKELLRLNLSGMGIYKISPAPVHSRKPRMEKVMQAAFYVEKISLAPSGPVNPLPQ